MRKRIKGLCTAVFAALACYSCFSWDVWDVKFKRASGWIVGDGAYSLGLPPLAGSSGGRIFWWFGDTLFRPSSQPPLSGTLTDTALGNELLLGNTMGVSSYTSDRSVPGAPTFYARQATTAGTACGNASQWGTNCPVTLMTSQAGGGRQRGFIPDKVDSDWIWPGDAVYVSNPSASLPAGYTPGAPFTSTTEKFMVMAYLNHPFDIGGPAATGFNVTTNVEQNVSSWVHKGKSAETGLDTSGWGIQWPVLLHANVPGWGEDDKIRIYGMINHTNPPFLQLDVILAVAWPSLEIVRPQNWFYAYKGNGTSGSPCPSSAPCFIQVPPTTTALKGALKHVAENVTPDFSVDYICHDEPGTNGNASVNACSFVMVHGASFLSPGANETVGCGAPPNVDNPRWFVVRTTNDDAVWPLVKTYSDGTTRSTIVKDALPDPAVDQKVLCGMNNGRKVRQIRAHDDISPPGKLYVSWYVGGGCPNAEVECTDDEQLSEYLFNDGETNKTQANRVSNVRFGAVLLNQFRPWCTAVGSCP